MTRTDHGVEHIGTAIMWRMRMLPGTAALVAGALLLSPLAISPAHAAWDTVITNAHPADDEKILPGDVTFTYTTGEGGSTYECQLNDAGAWVPCNSNTITYPDLAPGSYVFRVKGSVLGSEDPTPAERYFIVRNVPCEQASADYKDAQTRFFKWHTKKGYKKEALQRAKAAGNEAKVKRIKKKIKALNKLIRAARNDMEAATTQQHAVC